MLNIWNTCLDFFAQEDTRRHLKESLIYPVGQIIYNEIYIYIWMICLYHVFLIFIILANLFILLRYFHKENYSHMYLNPPNV